MAPSVEAGQSQDSIISPLARPEILWIGTICMLVIQFTLGVAVAMVSAELLLILWLGFHTEDRHAGLLLAFCFFQCPVWLLIYYGYTDWLDRAYPWKFDPLLLSIDRWLGFDGFAAARPFYPSAAWRAALRVPYEGVQMLLILWFGLHFRDRTYKQYMTALVLTFLIGAGICYRIVPACGPVFAFPGFPKPPSVAPASHFVRLDGIPNCIPSLHVATALLFVLFPTRDRIGIAAGWFFFLTITFTTIAMGQHYLIDLILAVPFAVGCAALARRQWSLAATCLVPDFGAMIAVRMLA